MIQDSTVVVWARRIWAGREEDFGAGIVVGGVWSANCADVHEIDMVWIDGGGGGRGKEYVNRTR